MAAGIIKQPHFAWMVMTYFHAVMDAVIYLPITVL